MTDTSLAVACYPWLTYAPLYVAERRGLFAEESLRIDIRRHTGRWSALIDRLDDDVDLIIGNAWFALRASSTQRPQCVVAPCGLNCRFVIVTSSARPVRPFEWTDLLGCTVAVPTGIPTPWFALLEALRRTGIRSESVGLLVGYDDDEACSELIAGRLDYALTDLDNAQRHGLREVTGLADVLGPVPWSVFCASASRVGADPVPYQRFRRAIGSALRWIASSSDEEVAQTVAAEYQHLPADVLIRATRRYRELQVWAPDERLSMTSLKEWEDALLLSGGVVAPSDLAAILPFDSDALG